MICENASIKHTKTYNNMKRKLILPVLLIICILYIIILAGCSEPSYIKTSEISRKKDNPSFKFNLYYFKDTRTELCFAWSGLDSTTITNVPCNEKVLELIK